MTQQMRNDFDSTDRFLRIIEVMSITGLSRSGIYRAIRESDFPKQMKIGFSSRWSLAEVAGWMERVKENR
jgi:prophage regulatory protein